MDKILMAVLVVLKVVGLFTIFGAFFAIAVESVMLLAITLVLSCAAEFASIPVAYQLR